MIWIVLACIFGVFMGKVIRDEGLGWGSTIIKMKLLRAVPHKSTSKTMLSHM